MSHCGSLEGTSLHYDGVSNRVTDVLPPNSCAEGEQLRGGALKGTLRKLLDWEFIVEVSDDQSWRMEDAGTRVGLRTTSAGLTAIGLTATAPTPVDAVASEQATDALAYGTPSESPDVSKRSAPKRSRLIDLLSHGAGVSISELASAFEWLPHTTRAALTGLRQRGIIIVKSKRDDGTTIYRITAEAPGPLMPGDAQRATGSPTPPA